MFVLDITLLLVIAMLHRVCHAPRVSEIIYFEFLVGILIGYLTVPLKLYTIIDPAWFFVLRAYIMLGALVLLVVENASRIIGLVVVSGMVYNLLMFFEYALDRYTWVDTYYTPFMVINMLLHIVYVFGIGDGGRILNEWIRACYRSITDRLFCGIICNTFA